MKSIHTEMEIDKSLVKQFAKETMSPGNLKNDKDLTQVMCRMMKHFLEATPEEETELHPGYGKYAPEGQGTGNSRNGSGKKPHRAKSAGN